jgi:hypothetical protein
MLGLLGQQITKEKETDAVLAYGSIIDTHAV